jgi:hypothetical protein
MVDIKKTENLLEAGAYKIHGKGDGIDIDKIELKGMNGSHRIWKLNSISEKKIIFDIEKFG